MKKFYLLSFFIIFGILIIKGQNTLVVQVSSAEDDQEEVLPGSTQTEGAQDIGSSDLELGSENTDGTRPQLVGIRFDNIDLPKGAIITGARIIFTVDEPDKKADPALYEIRVEDSDNPGSFTADPYNISSRSTLPELTSWMVAPNSWTMAGESGQDQTTPDISSLVQMIVNRPGWAPGNAMVFIIKGSGTRTAESYDGSPAEAPKLEIDYIQPQSSSFQVMAASDDQEEVLPGSSGTVGIQDVGSSDLELGSESTNGSQAQLVGIRFAGVDIPKGSVIISAHIQFTVDEPDKKADPCIIMIKAQNDDNPVTFGTEAFNISSREMLPEMVVWDIPTGSWNSAGEAGPDQKSSDISSLVQALVDREGWNPGNAMVFTLEGTGTRTAESYDGSPAEAPVLNIEYIGTSEYRFRIASASDDQEEVLAGSTNTEGNQDVGSSDLELGSERTDGSEPQIVGLRFTNLEIPKGALVQSAYIQFTVDEGDKNADPASYVIKVQDDDNPLTFTADPFNITSRPMSDAVVGWEIDPETWTTAGQSGPAQKTPDLAPLVQMILNREGWAPGNAMVFTITGTGTRTAESYDGSPSEAAELIITLLSSEPGLPSARFPIGQRQAWSYSESIPVGDWTSLNFSDSLWANGPGILGFNVENLGTELSGESNSVYFRKRVVIESLDDLSSTVGLSLLVENSAEVYINGTKVTNVTNTADGDAENTYFLYELEKSIFSAGENIIAIKVDGNGKLKFDASLDNLELNTANQGITCEENDLHISCFESLFPTTQDDFIVVPADHVFQYIAREDDPYTDGSGSYGDNFDFTGFVPIDGSSSHGYLSINYETDPGGVSITEVKLNNTTGLWEIIQSQAVDYSGVGGGTVRPCSGTVTPWGTIISCEEDYGGNMDSDGDGYLDIGWCIEIDPATASIVEYGTGAPQKLWALGRMSHENVVIATDERTVYFGEDAGDGSVYKFVAETPRDLSSGELFVLKLDGQIDGNFESSTPTGTWMKVPNSTFEERNNVKSIAKNTLGATTFSGVEDVEISPIDGMIYFAVKGNAGKVYRFKDDGSTFSEFETFIGGKPYVLNIDGKKVIADWFGGQDNLTFDDRGNLYVLQDGGNNYIWLVSPDHTQENPAVEIFFHSPNGAEPTGMTFTPDFRYMFMSVQHPSAGTPQEDIAGTVVTHNRDVAIAIARSNFLGRPQTGTTSSPMISGLNNFETLPVYTVGEHIGDYLPTGIFDGMGATQMESGDVRFYVNSEITSNAGYPYVLANGAEITGARIHYFDISPEDYMIKRSGLAYDKIINRDGTEVTSAGELEFGGLNRFCSGALFEAGEYGLVNTIMFSGEETGGGTEYLLDVETNTLYAAPWLGKAAWESITMIESKDENKVVLVIGDDRSGAPFLMYVGEKGGAGKGDFLDNNGFAQGKLYVWVADSGLSPEDYNGTGNVMSGNFVEIAHYNAGGGEGYDELGFATQDKQDELAAAVGAFQFSRPEDVATNPQNGSQIVLASTGRGQTYPSDNWGTTYLIDIDVVGLTGKVKIIYDGDDAGAGQFEGPDFGMRSPDNLEWASDGKIYIQEDRSTSPGSLFGSESGEEASIWQLNPVTGKLLRIGQVDRSAVPTGQSDPSPNDIGNWETSGVIDVSEYFSKSSEELVLFVNTQAHSLRDGIIADGNLVEGGQLLFMKGQKQPISTNGAMVAGLNSWSTIPIFTVGEAINGYRPTGIFDGIGAAKLEGGNVRFYVNSELTSSAGYPYKLANGAEIKGARVHYFDVDPATYKVVDGGLAFNKIINRNGTEVTDATQLEFGGLNRLCSAALFEAGEFGLVNSIFFTGEETGGGTEYLLDIETKTLYAAPWLGRAGWENVTMVETGNENTIGVLVGDDREGAPLILYIGEKGAVGDGSFLDNNGFAQGKLYVWVANNASSPEDFNGTNVLGTGSFVEIPYYLPGGGEGYDEMGFAIQSKQDELAAMAGAFEFSRPEDLATNPGDGTQIVLASTGRGNAYPSDNWGTVYYIDIDFSDLSTVVKILYDGDDAGAGQFEGPDYGLRSPDNLDWADNGKIYLQEDRSTSPGSLFGGTSGEEASIWELNPLNGLLTRIGQVDRASVPLGQTDPNPSDIGNWETSGILDVSELFGAVGDERIFIIDAQAHNVRDGIIADSNLVEGGQLLLFKGNAPAINPVVYIPKLIPESDKRFDLYHLGTFETNIFDEGASEIVAYDTETQRAFAVNADKNTVSVISMTNPFIPGLMFEIDLAAYGNGVNSVDVANGIVAIASEAGTVEGNGKVVFFDTDGNYISEVEVGALPDMLTFTPDASKVLVANEGQPSDDYLTDPEGSVAVIDISGGPENPVVTIIDFTQFNGKEDSLRNEGIRIFGPGSTAAQDFEPEYIAVTEDGSKAYVNLQENNALLTIDLTSNTITGIVPLGYKDHSAPGNGLDASNRTDNILIQNWPVLGMYMPDATKSINISGADYIFTANEGDARDYDGYSEETRVGDIDLDPTAFPDALNLQMDENLGRLLTTTANGDIDGDGDVDQIYSYGARSFSIWDANGQLIFDSGDHFEQKLAELLPNYFNSNNDDNDSFKSRSDDKGPEPEAIELVRFGDAIFALVGLERIGGILIYDVTDPANPSYVNYVNNRNFTVDAESGQAGDLGIEDIRFVPAESSPVGVALIITSNEVSGTVSVFSVNEIPEIAVSNRQFDLFHIGSFETGVFDQGAAEIVAYDPNSYRGYATNANANTVSIIRLKNPFNPRLESEIDMAPYGDGVNSVDVFNGIVAVASQAEATDGAGKVVFFDTLGGFISSVEVGVLPDMLTFTPDGTKVLVANEGEPSDDYLTDPEGSVSIIDLSGGVENPTVSHVLFTQFNGKEDSLRMEGIRIFGPGASAAQDFEPEYIAITEDGKTAYVTLQENNALVSIDINSRTISGITPLGYKDHGAIGNGIDASNRSANIQIQNWPVLGMYLPDATKSINIDGADYIFTANEGDARDYGGYSEETRVEDLLLDDSAYPDAMTLQMEENLGRLLTTNANGDTDDDGDVDQIYSYGGRSFSIWNSSGQLIFDSGDHFEQKLAELLPDYFNSNNDDNDSFKSRSDDKGPEPEAIELVRFGDGIFALVGLERIGGILVYDVTNPLRPSYVSYVNNRDFTANAESAAAGDLGVEDIRFIPADQSPVGVALVLTSNEVSGTVSVFAVNELPTSTPTDEVVLEKIGFTVGPVPFEHNTLLSYHLEALSSVAVSLVDMSGRIIKNIVNERQTKGKYDYNIDGSNLQSGVYVLLVSINGKIGASKIIKQ